MPQSQVPQDVPEDTEDDEAEPADLFTLLTRGPARHRAELRARIDSLLRALGERSRPNGVSELITALDGALHQAGLHETWLALSVITAALPDPAAVARTHRSIRLDGPLPALTRALHESHSFDAEELPSVEVITEGVVVDVNHTFVHLRLATGIQRVVRETVTRWMRDHDLVFIGWTDHWRALRRITESEVERATRPVSAAQAGSSEPSYGDRPAYSDQDGYRDQDAKQAEVTAVIVPWKCTHIVPELPAEHGRADRYQALVRFSRCRTGVIGYDCVPLTAAETTADGMAGAFTMYLAAAADVDRIATISEAAASEYRGWRLMLSGAGRPGPEIACVSLPVEARTPTDNAMREARALLGIGPLPVILSVGSHEPRKNHLSLLHAADVLWREGKEFTLTFVGGNSWNSFRFLDRVRELHLRNRPVQTISMLPDELLWAAYRLAYCTVFTSLHEGFGLPVAESLASGTPVITSNFGSMREIAEGGGTIMVDPRRDYELADALRTLLLEPDLRQSLAAEALARPNRTWEQFAAETWTYLVHGETPPGSGPDTR